MSLLADAAPPAAAGRAHRPEAPLPGWPLRALLLGYPIWWMLGVAPFAVFAFGMCAAALMLGRPGIRLPRLWWAWLGFLLWGLASATMIDTAGRLVGFGQRWMGLVGCTALLLHVYNAPHTLTRRVVLQSLTAFLGWMTVGGYLGMLLPWGRLTTPAAALLPPALAANPHVAELLNPRLAEVQQPYGAAIAFVRPSAPFPYTNAWGHAFVLLLPVVLALALRSSTRWRWALLGLVALSVPPALATLNRGIFVGVGVGVLYVAARRLHRANLAGVLAAGLSALLIGGLVAVSGVAARVADRTSTSSTTADRADLYREALERALASPLVGYGAPRPSLTKQVSVGTQGHFWYLLFSHGFVGLGLFLLTLWGLAAVTCRVRDLPSLLLHTPVVVLGVTMVFYGVDALHLLLAWTCAMLLLRPEPTRLNWALLPAQPPGPASRTGPPWSMGPG